MSSEDPDFCGESTEYVGARLVRQSLPCAVPVLYVYYVQVLYCLLHVLYYITWGGLIFMVRVSIQAVIASTCVSH